MSYAEIPGISSKQFAIPKHFTLMNKQLLIFAYNANSDLFSTVTDFAHKSYPHPPINASYVL